MLHEPPVIARCGGAGLREGDEIEVRLTRVDEARREVEFTSGAVGE
jgi:hypothetical protein